MAMLYTVLFGGGSIAVGARVLKGDPRYGKVVKPSEDLIGWLFGKGK